MKKEESGFLTIEEAAEYCRMSVITMRNKIQNNEIVYYRPGGNKIIIHKDDLDKWINSSKNKTAPKIYCLKK